MLQRLVLAIALLAAAVGVAACNSGSTPSPSVVPSSAPSASPSAVPSASPSAAASPSPS